MLHMLCQTIARFYKTMVLRGFGKLIAGSEFRVIEFPIPSDYQAISTESIV